MKNKQIDGMTEKVAKEIVEISKWQGSAPCRIFDYYGDPLFSMCDEAIQNLVNSVAKEDCSINVADTIDDKDCLIWYNGEGEEQIHWV